MKRICRLFGHDWSSWKWIIGRATATEIALRRFCSQCQAEEIKVTNTASLLGQERR